MRERLQKIIAKAGIASRRKAEQLIVDGCVRVNGRVARLGESADLQKDHIKVNGKLIRAEPLEYYVVNKPRGVLSAASTGDGKPVVTALVPSKCRLYPAGRLDFNSEGLMILTNDGALTRKLTRAGRIEKTYRVKVRGVPTESALNRLRKGIKVEDVRYARCEIKPVKQDNNSWFEVRLSQGKNRQIRKMFQAVGHPVMKLRRTAVGPIRLGRLAVGEHRRLTDREISLLRKGIG